MTSITPKDNLPYGITLKCDEKGLTTQELMIQWLTEVYDTCPGVILRKRRMILLDASRNHITDKIKSKLLN
jgi:hypothetical protein